MTGFAGRLGRAFVIGVATIFQRKPEEDQHWSEPPTVPVDDEAEADESGDPPLPSDR
jgi:hypothetical protein